MKKQIISTVIDYDLDWEFGVKISEIRSDLDAIEALGATHVEIDHVTNYECDYITIKAMQERIETDEEYSNRFKKIITDKTSVISKTIQSLEKYSNLYNTPLPDLSKFKADIEKIIEKEIKN